MSKLSRHNQDVQDVIDAMVARSKLLKGEFEEAFCYLKKRVRELEVENADLQSQIKELSNHKREHHE
jgi:hypothetical protein